MPRQMCVAASATAATAADTSTTTTTNTIAAAAAASGSRVGPLHIVQVCGGLLLAIVSSALSISHEKNYLLPSDDSPALPRKTKLLKLGNFLPPSLRLASRAENCSELFKIVLGNARAQDAIDVTPHAAFSAFVHPANGVVAIVFIRRANLSAKTLELPGLVAAFAISLGPVGGVRGGELVGLQHNPGGFLLNFRCILSRLELMLDSVDGVPVRTRGGWLNKSSQGKMCGRDGRDKLTTTCLYISQSREYFSWYSACRASFYSRECCSSSCS